MPDWIRVSGGFLRDFGWAVVAVLGLVSLGFWVVEVFKEGRHPFNFWAVLALAILLASALLWGARRRGGQGGAPEIHHHYESGVTVNQAGGFSPPHQQSAGETPTAVRLEDRVIEGTPDQYRVVRPWEVMEEIPNAPTMIFGRTFRYVEMRGPALLGIMDGLKFIETQFAIVESHVGSIIWDFGSEGSAKLGPIGVHHCTFEHCRFENIGFTGDAEEMERMRKSLGTPETPASASPSDRIAVETDGGSLKWRGGRVRGHDRALKAKDTDVDLRGPDIG